MNDEKIIEVGITKDKPLDREERPKELREVEEKAYMILREYAWILRVIKGKYFIETRNINNLDKMLMFKIRVFDDESMVIDILSSDFDELETYKMMFWTERNREFFFDEFRDKESEWVLKD